MAAKRYLTFRINDTKCPCCKTVFNAVSLDDTEPPRMGDFAVCPICQFLAVFDGALQLLTPTTQDIADWQRATLSRVVADMRD